MIHLRNSVGSGRGRRRFAEVAAAACVMALSGVGDVAHGAPIPDVEWQRLEDGPDRAGHGMVYDPVNDVFWIFGGVEANVSSNKFHNTLHRLDASDPEALWQLVTISGAKPAPVAFHTLTYDPVRSRVIAYGGLLDTGMQQRLVDGNMIWFLDVSDPEDPSWSFESVPGNGTDRFLHGAAYLADFDALVVSAGFGFNNDLRSDSYALRLGTTPMSWVRLANAGLTPRAGPALVYDAARQRLVSYGGATDANNADATGEIRTLDLAGGLTSADTWERISPTTPSVERALAAYVFDAQTGLLWVHGGNDRNNFHRDLSVLDLSVAPPEWTRTNVVVNGPLDRLFHAAAYDSRRSRIVFQGGTPDNQRTLRDTRALVLSTVPTGTPTESDVATPTITPPIATVQVTGSPSPTATGPTPTSFTPTSSTPTSSITPTADTTPTASEPTRTPTATDVAEPSFSAFLPATYRDCCASSRLSGLPGVRQPRPGGVDQR